MIMANVTTLRMSELALGLSSDPHTLVTRPVGRKFLSVLESRLVTLEDSQACLLQCDNIRLIDASFADEVFAVLAVSRSRRQRRNGCLILDGLEDANLDNLEMALSSRTVRETGLRNCVMPVRGTHQGIRLVGKCEGHVQNTFEILVERRQVTARELADVLELDIAAASTRLKVLFDLGLVTRVEEREGQVKQFVYTWPL